MKIERNRKLLLGKEFETNSCGKCVVIGYNNNTDVIIKFIEYPHITRCRLEDLKTSREVRLRIPITLCTTEKVIEGKVIMVR